jgi:hypothetical protein
MKRDSSLPDSVRNDDKFKLAEESKFVGEPTIKVLLEVEEVHEKLNERGMP